MYLNIFKYFYYKVLSDSVEFIQCYYIFHHILLECQTWNLEHRLNHKIKTRWQLPWIVSSHPLDGHPPSKGQGWSPSIPGMVAYQPKVYHPLFKITIPSIVAQLPKDGHPWSKAWSSTIKNYWNLIKPRYSNQTRSLTLAQPSLF